MDIFPMGNPFPYRIELFDEKIETIRRFDPETQCSVEKVDKIHLFPAREYPLSEDGVNHFRQNWRAKFPGNPMESPTYANISDGMPATGAEYYLPLFYNQLDTLFDYLPENTMIVCTEPLPEIAEKFWQEVNSRFEQLKHDIQRPLCEPATIFLAPNDVFHGMKQFAQIHCHRQLLPEKSGNFNFATLEPPSLPVEHKAKKPLSQLEQFLSGETERVLFCAETTGRREILLELLSEIDVFPEIFTTWQDFLIQASNKAFV